MLEVLYAGAALLFAAAFVGDWSNTPADANVFTAAFLLLAITLPIVVITVWCARVRTSLLRSGTGLTVSYGSSLDLS